MTYPQSLDERVTQLEDRIALRELVSRYNFAVDERDLATLASLFMPDGFFGTADSAAGATGRDAICEQFKGRYSIFGATNHFSHDQVVTFESPTRARGMVASHAELWCNERATLAALRYADVYEKHDGAWRFAERKLHFMYYLGIEEYPIALGQRDRNRAGPTPKPADWPEGASTYVEYRPGKA